MGGEDLSAAIATAEANGGGNIAVSGQQSAAGSVIDGTGDSDVNVVALGGFSGRESEVDVDWLAGRVADGEVRWVLTDGSDGGVPADGRPGSSELMAAVSEVCSPVEMESSATGSDSANLGSATTATVTTNPTSGSSDSNVIYDCAGKASDLAAQ
jgi:hypothetical protein